MPPRVSVLMPVHNAQRYLEEALDSVLAQSFGDFELLVVDDGSTDGSLAVLRRYAARDHRVRLTSRARTGYLVALNQMLGEARGELAARMDADDVALPGRFARQVAFLDDHPDVVCVGGAFRMIDAEGRLLTTIFPPEADAEIQDLALQGYCSINHPSTMFRREAAVAAGGYRPEMMPAEDLDLWLRLGDSARLANLAEPVLMYRQHDKSVSAVLQDTQLERFRAVAYEACDRRGIPRRPVALQPWRPTDSRSRHRFAVLYGWWAFQSGEGRTALHYGLKAVGMRPWRPEGWRLLACAAFKPAPGRP
jgi:glycosyltransferase involved in cell wall biosynthesis